MAKKADAKRIPVTKTSEGTDSFISEIAAEVNSALKTDAVMIAGEDTGGDAGVTGWVRTLIPQLDFAIGGYSHPGVPLSRAIEVYGAEGSGKSTLACWLTKRAMDQMNAVAYYQDAERVLTPEIIRGTGINMNKVILQQPEILEEVFEAQETTLKIIQKKNPDNPVVITLDSVAACSTQSEMDGDYGDSPMGIHARLMSQGLRKIKGYIFSNNIMSIWVNQIREKMGITFGDKDETFGGKALKFYSSVRIKLTRVKNLKKSGEKEPYGCTIQALIKKNKVAPPLKIAEYDILFVQDSHGSYPRIDIEGAILDWCKENNLIGGGQGRFEVQGKSIFREQARQKLQEDPELFEEMVELAYSVALPKQVEDK